MKAERLRRMKWILEASRAELVDRMAAYKQIGIGERADWLEEMRLDTERELGIRTLDRGIRSLRDINAALRRIEDGTFGICMYCEGEIGERRLAALPWSPLCLYCQQAAEQENGGRSGRHEEFRPRAA